MPREAHASMGPLFFRAENVSPRIARGLVSQGFNGAALFQSGEPGHPPGQSAAPPASMGPLFFRAENQLWGRSPDVNCSFNGAALFQSGEPEMTSTISATARASMGPLFFRAENRGEPGVAGSLHRCFNGAALFQSGEPDLRRSLVRDYCGFNGAALFQSGEPACGVRRVSA